MAHGNLSEETAFFRNRLLRTFLCINEKNLSWNKVSRFLPAKKMSNFLNKIKGFLFWKIEFLCRIQKCIHISCSLNDALAVLSSYEW
jgi:hypothetical protein